MIDLFLVGPTGTRRGASLCTFVDNGTSGDLLPDDGVLSCTASIKSGAKGEIPLLALGKAGGLLVSQQFSLVVSRPLDRAAAAVVADQIGAIQKAIDSIVQQAGVTSDARIDMVSALRRNAAVANAGISPNGIDIGFTLKSGISLTYPLGLRDRATSIDFDRNATAQSFSRLAQARNAASARGFVYDAGYFDESEGLAIAGLLALSREPSFQNEVLLGRNAADVTGVFRMSGAQTTVITTHGVVQQNGDIAFLTREKSTPESLIAFSEDLQSGRLALSAQEGVFMITPKFVEEYLSFSEGSILFAGFCYSRFNDSMSRAFQAKGLSSYFGFTDRVASKWAFQVGTRAFCSLLLERDTTGGALTKIDPNVDPIDPARASIVLAGDGDVIYPGSREIAVTLNPSTVKYFTGGRRPFVLPLKASVGQGQELPCASFRWRTPGTLGGFSGSGAAPVTTLETNSSAVDFQFKDDAVFGKDSVFLDVFRRGTQEVIAKESLSVEPYCAVETTPDWETSIPFDDKVHFAVPLPNGGSVTYRFIAPGTEQCVFLYRWRISGDAADCVTIRDPSGNTGKEFVSASSMVTLSASGCFSKPTAFSPVWRSLRLEVALLAPSSTGSTPEELGFVQADEIKVVDPCVKVDGTKRVEVCCSDSIDNDGNGLRDCDDGSCSSESGCSEFRPMEFVSFTYSDPGNFPNSPLRFSASMAAFIDAAEIDAPFSAYCVRVDATRNPHLRGAFNINQERRVLKADPCLAVGFLATTPYAACQSSGTFSGKIWLLNASQAREMAVAADPSAPKYTECALNGSNYVCDKGPIESFIQAQGAEVFFSVRAWSPLRPCG